MKKNASQKAGWLFVAAFVGLHLLYCALNLMRCLLGRRPPFGIDSPLYRAVKRPLTVLRLFLAGPNLGWSTEPQDVMGWSMESQDITGACLIGVFVVAATVWLLARYGLGKTYLFWGVALALSILLCSAIGAAAGRLVPQRAIESRNFAEVSIRCAVYVCIYQIPTWLLYQGSRQLARDIVKDRKV